MQLIERSKTARIHEDWENDYLHSVLNTLSINLFYKKSEKKRKKTFKLKMFFNYNFKSNLNKSNQIFFCSKDNNKLNNIYKKYCSRGAQMLKTFFTKLPVVQLKLYY